MTDQRAVFGGGCFWCLHSALTRVKGVRGVVSGYAGGALKAPAYEQICTGTTGHAEVVQVVFDEGVLSYSDLLSLFFALHDPTTLNRQGADTGTQYRSVIFYDSDQQKEQALAKIEQLKQDNAFQKAIVTELSPLDVFYPAEDYHQDYYQRNPSAGYCQAVIAPKLKKFFQQYPNIIL